MSKRTSTPTARLVDLTPALAEELLGRNPRNRKFSKSNYEVVKRAIERGEWLVNGEAIKVSEGGYILDGQHRCRAVAETGITIRTFIIEGLPDATQDTMDTGRSRSLGDILSIHGEPNASSLASVVRRMIVAERYGLRVASGFVGGYPLTNKECMDWLESNPWVREYVHPGRAVARATPLGGAMASTLMRTFDNIDADDSTHFWGRVVDGLELTAKSPLHVLRTSYRIASEETKGERNQRYLTAVTIKAWNSYRDGDEISQLKYRMGGAKPEAFPEPK